MNRISSTNSKAVDNEVLNNCNFCFSYVNNFTFLTKPGNPTQKRNNICISYLTYKRSSHILQNETVLKEPEPMPKATISAPTSCTVQLFTMCEGCLWYVTPCTGVAFITCLQVVLSGKSGNRHSARLVQRLIA